MAFEVIECIGCGHNVVVLAVVANESSEDVAIVLDFGGDADLGDWKCLVGCVGDLVLSSAEEHVSFYGALEAPDELAGWREE